MLLVVGIAIFYILGFVFHWNYSVWWYDLFLHFLGGVWVAIAAKKHIIGSIGHRGLMGPILLVALVALVGVTWEIYEFSIDELFFEERARWRAQEGNTDTMTDLMMDLLGGVATASFFAHRSYRTNKTNLLTKLGTSKNHEI
mgnify:CR=1 FL=1